MFRLSAQSTRKAVQRLAVQVHTPSLQLSTTGPPTNQANLTFGKSTTFPSEQIRPSDIFGRPWPEWMAIPQNNQPGHEIMDTHYKQRPCARYQSTSSTATTSMNAKNVSMAAAGVATVGTLAYMSMETVDANMAADGLHPPVYPWEHKKNLATFDHAAIRRGYQVYKEVCAACHSLDRIAWRNLIGVSHTEAEVKAMAEEF
ncbi:cytochrome c1, partial [Linnemannia schmuckeri]